MPAAPGSAPTEPAPTAAGRPPPVVAGLQTATIWLQEPVSGRAGSADTALAGLGGRAGAPDDRGKKSRRAAFLGGAILVSAAIGCGGEASIAVDPGSAPAAGEATPPEPPVADTVIIALRRLPATLDPTAELDPWGQRVVDDLLFEGLTRRVPDAPWAEPALADLCQVEQDGRSVACRLRPGARFHDDQPVTVEDLVYSINLWIGPRGASIRQRYGLDDLKSVEAGPPPGATGTGWVRIGFTARDPLALERLAAVKIVPRARHAGPGRFSQHPIGTGPMALVSQTEEAMIFARREAIPGRARQIELRAQPDGAIALTALRRGEVHLLPELAPAHVPRELGKPGMAARFTAFLLSPPRYDVILYNLREGPQAGPRLRGALDLAIPRIEIASSVMGPGLTIAAPVDLSAPSPIDLVAIAEGRIDDAGLGPLTADPDNSADALGRSAADLILTELGWLDNRGQRRRGTTPLRLPLIWDGSPGLATGTVRAVRAAWKQIGITTPNVTAGWPYVLSLLRGGKYHVALVRLAGSSDMDLSPWFHSRGAHNLSGVADSELDAALEDYRNAGNRPKRDAAKQGIAARLAALHPVSVLYAPLQVLLASRGLTGLVFIDDLPRLDSLGLGALPGPDGLVTAAPLHGDGG